VVRALPEIEFSLMAGPAGFAPHKAGRRSWRLRHTPIRLRPITTRGQCSDCGDPRHHTKPRRSVQQIPPVSRWGGIPQR
jgi:hypothetical protein